MGNCQAIDNASLVIQHPNGRAERFYSPIAVADVIKLNPNHYVAQLLTTTLYSSRPPPAAADAALHGGATNNSQPLRITRIKLLRSTDTLALGHSYRLITTQEVMKGLRAKKNGKVNYDVTKLQPSDSAGKNGEKSGREAANQSEKANPQAQMRKQDKHRPRMAAPANSTAGAGKPRGWHPSLKSISEATI